MKGSILVILVCFLVTAFALELDAFTKGACKPDVKKYCPGMGFDKKKIEQCILEHRTEVSEPCKANIDEKLAERKAAKAEEPDS